MKAIVLAAGAGTRMKSDLPKCLHKILGRTMLDIALDTLMEAGITDIITVIGHDGDLVRASVAGRPVKFVTQPQQLGTGHAVSMAAKYIGPDEDVLVYSADMPLIKVDSLHKLIKWHEGAAAAVTVMSTKVPDPAGYGRIVYVDGSPRIVEQKDVNEAQASIDEINTGIYVFKGQALLDALPKVRNNNAAGEFYLTDTLEIIEGFGLKASVFQAEDYREFMGVNTRVQLAAATAEMRRRINDQLMLSGVTMLDPSSVWIDYNVQVGTDTVLYPGTILEGKTAIGQKCVIGPNSRIVDSKVGDETEVISSVILQSEVGEGCAVGPFAYMRPNSKVGDHCKIGDFVEVKNSTIASHTKASHLTYIGDSDVGSYVNFGCGTVTVNYDGEKKYRTTIEDHAFIGCNTNLIAPVKLKEGAYTAAGSTITNDVPEGALGVARSRQTNIDGWVKRKLPH
jgi:bifunctional UDP-N-acetylglucosamine pyrophosphorylase/glucosamine-1-phosphate N-acetyltransferase